MTLIYMGDEYYNFTGGVIGVLYTEDWTRYDWGFVQMRLREGVSVTIRPATSMEKLHLDAKYAAYLASQHEASS